jgi:two-component system CheB/CheR fusion protein
MESGDSRQAGARPAAHPGGNGPILVTIGASAGGIGALQALFAALPERTGAAFVVVIHLDPQYRSELAQILSVRTRMPVLQVETTEKIHADHVYVIPPDRRLQLMDHEI